MTGALQRAQFQAFSNVVLPLCFKLARLKHDLDSDVRFNTAA